MTTPSVVLNNGGKKKKINICKTVATLDADRWRTHYARTNVVTRSINQCYVVTRSINQATKFGINPCYCHHLVCW